MRLRDATSGKSYRVVAVGFDPDGPHYEMRGTLEGFMKFRGDAVGVFQGGGSFKFLVRPDDVIELEEEKRRYIW